MFTHTDRYKYQVLDCALTLSMNKNGASEDGAKAILEAYDFLAYRRANWQNGVKCTTKFDNKVKELIDIALSFWKDEIKYIRYFVETGTVLKK